MSDVTAAVVVSYNGAESIGGTVRALIDQVDSLIIVDNGSLSECVAKLAALAAELPKIQVIELAENVGVGRALNIGARAALEMGARWIVTMDQDTTAADGMVSALARCAELGRGDLVVATQVSELKPMAGKSTCVEVRVAITSGNLVSLEAWQAVGGYDEALFIDSVDFDFCLRLRKSGRRLLRCSAAQMRHRLGTPRRLGSGILSTVVFVEHSPRRRYYMLRNHLYLVRKYWKDFPIFLLWKSLHMGLLILRVFVFGKDRAPNARAFALAIRDFLRNRFGPCEAEV